MKEPNRTEEEFNRAWGDRTTMHLINSAMAVLSSPKGARIILHHGGTKQAIELDREQADDLREALG